MQKKILLTIIIITVFATAFSFAAIFNVGGLGDSLSGLGGPIGTGALSLSEKPLAWALTGGGPTIFAFYMITLCLWPLFLAYVVWHWKVPEKFNHTMQPSTAETSGYTNTMNREPADPEVSS